MLVAQKTWNLQKCLQYGLQHSIDVNIQSNNLDIQKINLYQSKANLLPSLNMGVNLNNSFGRNIDGNTNTITYRKTLSNTYWISSSIDLFHGFVKLNTLRMNKYLLSVQEQETEIVKNKLITDIITAYYTLQYSIGLENVAKSQVQLAHNQYTRMKKLVAVGRETPLNLQDLKRQWMVDQLSYTQVMQAKELQILKLKKLLRLQPEDQFRIADDQESVIVQKVDLSVTELTKKVQTFPSIKKQDFMLKVAQKEYAIAKGKVLPSLQLAAGYNTYFFDANQFSFATQLQNNQNQQIFLGLNIPIFNGASVHSEIKRKRLMQENQRLLVAKQKEELQMIIKQTYDQVQAASNAYTSSLALLEYSEMSFETVQKKLEKGLASTIDFELAKQQFSQAKADKIKSKLTYKIYHNILVYYQTGNWNHVLHQ